MNVSVVVPDANVIAAGLNVSPVPVGVTVRSVLGACDNVIVRLPVVLPTFVAGKLGDVTVPKDTANDGVAKTIATITKTKARTEIEFEARATLLAAKNLGAETILG